LLTSGSEAMAIYRLLRVVSFDRKQEALMAEAYEKALVVGHIDRTDPWTDLIASRIVHIVQKGETNLWPIVSFALEGFHKVH
jgi:hypothetical protein